MNLISHTLGRAAAAAIACAAILTPSVALAVPGHPVTPGHSIAPTARARPAVGPVPRGFAADSVTFVSPGEAFVLGTAPCAVAPCTSIVRTLDRGASWVGVPAPVVKIGGPGLPSAAVWGIRFATPLHGFVFGTGLWVTTDGSAHWTQITGPGGSILSLATIDGQVLALTARCTPTSGCAMPGTLMRRPLGGGRWSRVTSISYSLAGLGDLTDLIATQARVAALLDGSHVLVTKNGGVSFVRRATPCTGGRSRDEAVSVAVTSASGLALLCDGGAASGHSIKDVYVSGDDGVRWHKAGTAGYDGIEGVIGAATPGQLTVTADSFGSWLYHSADGGRTWRTARFFADDGLGFADLGFTTSADGVVVHGAVDVDGNRDHRPGQLLLTGNAGASWVVVRF